MAQAKDVPLKQCSHCREAKPATSEFFSKRAQSKDGLSYNCKMCDRKIAKASYARRKDKKKRQEYYQNNREKLLAKSAQNYQEHREERLKRNKEYRAAKPETARKASAKRYRLMQQNKGKPYTRQQIIERDSIAGIPICQICGTQIIEVSLIEIDHIIPVAVGGKDCYDNVRVVCGHCNRRRPKDGRDENG